MVGASYAHRDTVQHSERTRTTTADDDDDDDVTRTENTRARTDHTEHTRHTGGAATNDTLNAFEASCCSLINEDPFGPPRRHDSPPTLNRGIIRRLRVTINVIVAAECVYRVRAEEAKRRNAAAPAHVRANARARFFPHGIRLGGPGRPRRRRFFREGFRFFFLFFVRYFLLIASRLLGIFTDFLAPDHT